MKKIILTLIALPMFLVACGKKGDDSNLQGTWIGKVKVSDLQALNVSKEVLEANKELTTETFIIKFDDGSYRTYRFKDSDAMSDAVEREVGTYTAEDQTLRVNIKAHSCVEAEGLNPRKLKKTASYELSEKLNELKVNFSANPNKAIMFTKLEGEESDHFENTIKSAETGCFTNENGKPGFAAGKVQKPKKEIDLEAKLEEVKKQTQEEDSNTQPRVEY